MKKLGIVLTALGACMLLGAMFSFGWSIYHAVTANEAYQVSIPAGQTHTSPVFQVDTSEHVQVALVFHVLSDSVQENLGDDSSKWTARYDFPVIYRVLDEQGNEIYKQDCHASWEQCGTRSKQDEKVDARGGTVTVEHGFDKFRVSAPGRIQVEVFVGEDTRYAAIAQDVELLVYDKVITHTVPVATGIGLLLFAPLMLIVGILLIVIPSATSTNLPATDIPANIRTWAMFAHLASLLAYIGIPFGHIFGPLIVWLAKKDDDPFVDMNARESLNFQISMTIYFMIAFILIFVAVGIVMLFVLVALHIALSVLAALKANDGQFYRYPFTIRFL